MTEAKLAVNFFVALFALIDPIGNVPLFAAATLGAAAAGRRMVAVYIGLFMTAFLIFFYFTGVGLLAFFGIYFCLLLHCLFVFIVFHYSFQLVKPVVPHFSERFNKVCHFFHFFCVDMIINFSSALLLFKQITFGEYLQVL